MYKAQKAKATTLRVNASYVGETIEQKINRILNNKEPIKDGSPAIYTDRKDGVKAEYDIRTDRFEIAVNATDYISKSKLAKREERLKAEDIKTGEKKIGGTEPTGTTTSPGSE